MANTRKPTSPMSGSETKPIVRLDDLPEVMTALEAAELLRLPYGSICRMAHRGELPAKMVAREWRFLRSKLMAYLAGDWLPASQAKPAPRRRGRPPKVLNLDLLQSIGGVH